MLINKFAEYFCAMIGCILVAIVWIALWAGPILMMTWFESAWWLCGYFITMPLFFGILDWAEGDDF